MIEKLQVFYSKSLDIIYKNNRLFFFGIDIILVGIIFSILSQSLMSSIIEMTLQPYRFIPVIVFSAISIGMIFSNSNTSDQK